MTLNEAAPPESVLLILQGSSPDDHPGIVDGYKRLAGAGRVKCVDIMPVFGPEGVVRGPPFWDEAIERAEGNGCTLVVFQYYHSHRLPNARAAIRLLKQLPSKPFVVSTLGDPFMNGYFGRPNIPPSFLAAAELSDLVTLTSMGSLADRVARATKAPIMLLPHGACQVRFGRPLAGQAKDFDVVFIGSRNTTRNPLRPNAGFAARRRALVSRLEARFGASFGLFGNGWQGHRSNQGPVPFDLQAQTAGRGRVALGGIPFSRARYYTSNRPFIQITSGTPFVDSYVPGVDLLLETGRHWRLGRSADLISEVERVLELSDGERASQGVRAASYVLERHTQAHRVATLVENVRRLRAARLTGATLPPHMPYFLPGVELEREVPAATRNWPSQHAPLGRS